MTEKKSAKLVVLGAGPGGYTAAFLAADLGLPTILVDTEKNPGGVCLYRGCIPSKALLHVAKVLTEAKEASNFGVIFPDPDIDIGKVREWKEGVVRKLTDGLGRLAGQRKVDFVHGRGSFIDKHTLKVDKAEGGDVCIDFENCILATGSRPAVIPNSPPCSLRIFDSSSALNLSIVPKNMLVIGGGYIGLELGSVYAALGSKISVVEMTSGLLPGVDKDLVLPLAKRLEKQFVEICFNTQVEKMTETGKGVEVVLKKNSVEERRMFDAVLVAVGRKPNTNGLGLETAGVMPDERGFVKVNEQRRTDNPGIFAVGDLTGHPMLAHKASHEAQVAVETILGHKSTFKPQAIPAVVFTDPEIAWCGLTETEAKKENRAVKIARFPWAASGRAATLGRTEGVTKLVFDPESGRILGVGICGYGAGELIAEGVTAVEMGVTAYDLKSCIHPHPTLSETLMEASEVFFGRSTHLYRSRR